MSSQTFENLAELVKVLAHPGRLEIIHLLRSHSLTVSQITNMLGERQAYVSQQLMALKQAELVEASRSGKEMYYELKDPRITEAVDNLYALVSKVPLAPVPEPIVVDPVCGMNLKPSRAYSKVLYAGVLNYFCGAGCRKEFLLTRLGRSK